MDLLYPFYLDTDMSMAFSAVLAGGVALEEEHVGRLMRPPGPREISELESEVEAPEVDTPEAQREDGASEDPDDESPGDSDEIMFGDDIAALTPVVHGPAVQILPLAICS